LEEVKKLSEKLDKLKLNSIYSVIVLVVIASFVTFALSATNFLTGDIIEKQRSEALAKAMSEVYPDADVFEEFPEDLWPQNSQGIESAYKVFNGESDLIGLVVVSKSRGYGGDVTTMTGISTDGRFEGFLVLSDSETPGLGKKIGDKFFTDKFIGKKPFLLFSVRVLDDSVNYIDSIAGATISSRAMTESANEVVVFAKEVYKNLGIGGEN
jgi:electron transport complex protein RnfG